MILAFCTNSWNVNELYKVAIRCSLKKYLAFCMYTVSIQS